MRLKIPIRSLLGEKFADIEEKYDLKEVGDGFSDDGEEATESEDAQEDDNNFTDDL